jgi:hypothetical protein
VKVRLDEACDRQRESLGPTFRDVTIDVTHLLHSQRVARDVHGRANPGRWILDDRYGGYPNVVGGDELQAVLRFREPSRTGNIGCRWQDLAAALAAGRRLWKSRFENLLVTGSGA